MARTPRTFTLLSGSSSGPIAEHPLAGHASDTDRLPYATVSYERLLEHLAAAGWRKQDREWFDEKETPAAHTHRIEWWNLGRDFMLVYELHGFATVSRPLTLTQLNTALARRRGSRK